MRTPIEYEKFVRDVVAEVSVGGTVVHHAREFTGRVSGRKIVVDVSFDLSAGGGATVLVLVECKRYRQRVEVSDVEEFHSKLDDIGAHKGIMVTTVGFESGAVATAKGRGIALATLTDSPVAGEVDFRYILASAKPPLRTVIAPPLSDKLLQGRFVPWGDLMGHSWDEGFRFRSFGDLWTLMFLSSD